LSASGPLYYDDVKMDVGLGADIIVDHKLLIEIKSIEAEKTLCPH
jgi:hypothetical protein